MENVITFGLEQKKGKGPPLQASMDELERLVHTAGGRVLESHSQKRDRPDPATFIGKGKIEELAERLRAIHATTLVLDDELKPGQQRHLEEAIGAKVVDRTRLILDIFAQRARTREGILQVELAQLQYLLPRVTERFGRFEQQTGGIGTRGPGERKLEVDRRRIRDRIALLKRQMEHISKERRVQRDRRGRIPMPRVALAGYTNAGKSSLLNALLARYGDKSASGNRSVYADDLLFATLDPTTRRIRLPSGRHVLFSDTVGFIRKLPTELVAAFRATLEEAREADAIVLVIDGSDPAWQDQEQTVRDVLASLGPPDLDNGVRAPVIAVFNKIDQIPPAQRAALARRNALFVSARTGEGLETFIQEIERVLAQGWVEETLELSHDEGNRLAQVYDMMDVISKRATPEGWSLRVRTHPTTLARFLKNP